ncbi:MAG TPA: FMN-binding protein [Burkholderiales bacterium]|jgi:Na+-translocating ferredoxin:NAD+ oxidoreductase RnfG subunit
MSDFIHWLAPAAIAPAAIAAVQHCYAAQYLTLEQAQATIFPEARRFAAAPVRFSPDQARQIEKLAGAPVRVPEQQVWEARSDSRLLGWFIVDEVYGKHEFITYAVGLNADGSVRQIEVMDYRETYGYEIRNAAWRRQFVGKRHGDSLKLDQDIRNISGATLSCRHIAEGVRRLLALHEVALR